MAEAYYPPTPATDGATMNPVPGASFQVFETTDTTFSTPLSLRVGSGNPTTTVTASETLATLPGVYVTSDNFEHIWKAGSFEWRRDSIDGAKAAIEAAKLSASDSAGSASTAASEAATSAQAARDAANLVDAPADTAVSDLINNSGSQTVAALASRDALNIIDYGVVRGAATSQTAAIKTALDANPGKAFYFPPGDYRLDTELVISQANSLILAEGARIYAAAAMTTMITYLWSGTGYAEDKSITGQGWLLDGGLNAQRILSIGKVIRFSLSGGNFKDGINRGLVTEAGLGAEIIAEDLRFYNSTATNVTDNIAIEAKMGDSHYRDVIIRDWTVAVKDTAFNRWDRVHPWISQDTQANPNMTNRYPTSIGFDITGNSDMQACVADSYRYAYKFRTNGTSYTPPARLLNCRAMWANDPILPTALATSNPAYCFDNTDGIGFISDRFTATGHSTVPGNFLTGPTTGITTRNTFSYGYIKGNTGSTSESLDYRNGALNGNFTYTPSFSGTTGAGTHTYTVRSGRYIVEGDRVTYWFRVKATLDSTTAFAGSLRITGAPVPVGSTNIRDAAGSVGFVAGTNIMTCAVFNGTSATVVPYTITSSGALEIDIPALRGTVVDVMGTITATHFKA